MQWSIFGDSSDAHNLVKRKATIIVKRINITAREGDEIGSINYITNLKNTQTDFKKAFNVLRPIYELSENHIKCKIAWSFVSVHTSLVRL